MLTFEQQRGCAGAGTCAQWRHTRCLLACKHQVVNFGVSDAGAKMNWIDSLRSAMTCVDLCARRVRSRNAHARQRPGSVRHRTVVAWLMFAVVSCARADALPDAVQPISQAEQPIAQSALVHQIVLAASTSSPYPDVSNQLPVERAYAIQHAVIVELLKQSPLAGFKAGLTDVAARQRFAATDAISGVLLGSGRLGNRATVQLDADDNLMIELEVGYVLGRAITTRLAPTDDPLEYVGAVCAAIELPNLNFVAQPSLVDVIASNVSAQQFIVGARVPVLSASILDELQVRLARDDVQIAEGVGRAALGGQRDALRWLINSRLAQGDTFSPGQILITGALAGMVPAKPGHYRAVFGALGLIEFTLTSTGGSAVNGGVSGQVRPVVK